jgi:hypothetical protein
VASIRSFVSKKVSFVSQDLQFAQNVSLDCKKKLFCVNRYCDYFGHPIYLRRYSWNSVTSNWLASSLVWRHASSLIKKLSSPTIEIKLF